MDLGLSGRRVLVTAGYRGTGAAMAEVFAEEGAEVIVHGFEPGQGTDLVASIEASGGRVSYVSGDLRSDDGAAELAEAVGPIDVLVNNYGTPLGSRWGSMDHWADEWDVNVLTGVRMAQALIPAMRDQRWGRIVFMGTVGNRMPGVRNAGYYGAKAALASVVRSLAQELRGSGITCNLVSPGMIATAEVRASIEVRAARHGQGDTWDEAVRWALSHTMPNLTEQIPDPADVARVVVFVASEPAWHITGAEIPVDGGAVDAR